MPAFVSEFQSPRNTSWLSASELPCRPSTTDIYRPQIIVQITTHRRKSSLSSVKKSFAQWTFATVIPRKLNVRTQINWENYLMVSDLLKNYSNGESHEARSVFLVFFQSFADQWALFRGVDHPTSPIYLPQSFTSGCQQSMTWEDCASKKVTRFQSSR
jgi:hypothetical protein